jgi:dTDP-4-amino-4,6-dideoxygalactose transaminase
VKQVSTPKTCWKDDGDAHFHTYNQYVIRASRRDELQASLKRAGVGTEVYYPRCLHEQDCFGYLGYRHTDFPQAQAASRETLALPIYPELRQEQLDYVVREIIEFFDTDRSEADSNTATTGPARNQ